MKVYLYLFFVFTIAESLFTVVYYLVRKKLDNILLLGLIIYAATMIIAFTAYKVEKYLKRRKALIDSLPEHR